MEIIFHHQEHKKSVISKNLLNDLHNPPPHPNAHPEKNIKIKKIFNFVILSISLIPRVRIFLKTCARYFISSNICKSRMPFCLIAKHFKGKIDFPLKNEWRRSYFFFFNTEGNYKMLPCFIP